MGEGKNGLVVSCEKVHEAVHEAFHDPTEQRLRRIEMTSLAID
jgi:multidrug efflux pump subunit AcrB